MRGRRRPAGCRRRFRSRSRSCGASCPCWRNSRRRDRRRPALRPDHRRPVLQRKAARRVRPHRERVHPEAARRAPLLPGPARRERGHRHPAHPEAAHREALPGDPADSALRDSGSSRHRGLGTPGTGSRGQARRRTRSGRRLRPVREGRTAVESFRESAPGRPFLRGSKRHRHRCRGSAGVASPPALRRWTAPRRCQHRAYG